jgi:UDP-N-acetylmuramyl pentapeptide phosphotransferase/UDP-N-acetylglucosamine-1-phosphate transferase
MREFFAILLNVVIVFTIVAFLASVIFLCLRTDDHTERTRRLLSLLLGVLVVAGAQAAKISYPDFLAKSLSSSKPSGGAVLFFATVIPGGAGVGMGWYMTYVYRHNPRMAARILPLVGILATGALAGIYANASNARGLHLGVAAIPNIAFVAGVIFYLVFNDEQRRGGSSWLKKVSDLRPRNLKNIVK